MAPLPYPLHTALSMDSIKAEMVSPTSTSQLNYISQSTSPSSTFNNGTGNPSLNRKPTVTKKVSIPVPTPLIGRDGIGIQVPSRKGVNGKAENNAAPKKVRQRKRVNTAEKRASHNAVERQRREALNGKFLDLARLLPTLAALRRPSKSSIVNASISHLTHQRQQRLLAARELRSLFSINQELLKEVNDWRSRNGVPAKTGPSAGEWTDGMEEVVSVEQEEFGVFDGGVGGDNEGDEEDAEDNEDEEEEVAPAPAPAPTASYPINNNQQSGMMAAMANNNNGQLDFGLVNGLVTARSSIANSSVEMFNNMNFNRADEGRLSLTTNGSPFLGQSFSSNPSITNLSLASQQQHALNAFLSESFDTTSMAHSPLGGSASLNGSNADGVVTPPPTFTHDFVGSAGAMGSFLESPPPSGAAATSFSVGQGNNVDKVTDWASQQMMIQQFSQNMSQGGNNGCTPDFSGRTPQGFGYTPVAAGRQSASPMSYPQPQMANNSHLGSAHQSLMAVQPHMANAVFPPPVISSPPQFMDFGASGLHQQQQHHRPRPSSAGLNAAAAQAQIVQAAAGLGLTQEQMEHWKVFAMQSFMNQQQSLAQGQSSMSAGQPSMTELRDAVRAGMTVGMGLINNNHHQWSESPGLEQYV